ncbi:MAG: ABC transporter substrate-binding protein [Gammaproteobacteria bacterium]|nr:ABC transporter substrate-binding protein [Gammaproteobacteria bacterium]
MKCKAGLKSFGLVCLLCISTASSALDEVKLQLRWYHQFQFAGYYMAIEKGFYRQQGIDAILIPGGPHALKPVDLLLNGQVDFAITSSGIVIHRMQGDPVVAIAAIMQTSPLTWITLDSSNIRIAQDLPGHTALTMPPPEGAELLAILKHEGINSKSVNIEISTYNIEDLISNKVQAFNGYISNEPYYLTQRGIKYHLIKPRDYGINFYSDVLVTSERLAHKDPELVKRFTKASLKGWMYALNHIEETVNIIHEKYAPNKTLEHLRYEAQTIQDLVMPELVQLGHMNPGRWGFIAKTYADLGIASGNVDLEGFIFNYKEPTNYFLPIAIIVLFSVLLGIAAFIIYHFRKLSQALKRSNQELASLAISDPLTGIMNRRGFMENAERLMSMEERNKQSCSLMVLDIDYFKKINDKYGHPVGDFCLIEFTEIIQSCCRLHDLVARIGGEEFVILLSDCDTQQAREKASYIIKRVNDHEFKPNGIKDTIKLTVSIGLAEVKGNLIQAWQHADEALYAVKNSGRNGLQIYMAST